MIRHVVLVPVMCLGVAVSAGAQSAPANTATGAPNARTQRVGVEADAVGRAAAALSVEYLIGPEDVLDISVWKNPELSREVPVRPDGKVSLPLIHDIQAAGLTPSQLRDDIARRLAEYVPSAEVSVIVQEVQSLKVAVVGAVKTPGRFMLKSPATVLECLALAQGFTEFANRERIVVLRQNGSTTQRIPFNYRKITDGNDQDNFFVRPGDIIVVP